VRHQHQYWQRVIAASSLMALSFITATQALPTAGAHAPAGVPADFVITPFGYFHPSCVNHLAHGDVLHQEAKTIARANGAVENIQACAYPHYRADGEKVVGAERASTNAASANPDISHAWVEWAGLTTTGAYGFQLAFWNVPPAPVDNDGQTVYLFNGLEDYNDVVTIIQPVLGWNSDYASAWGIAAWNCCESGSVYEGTPTKVSSGDLIYGYMFDNCATGVRTCSSWDIVAWDLTNRNFSELVGTSNYGQEFNWAFGGVLEVYNIAQCGDYPDGSADDYRQAGPSINFYGQALWTSGGAQVKTPAWTISTASGLSPSCNYGGTLPKEVILTY